VRKIKPLKILLVLTATSSLLGCADGPLVTECVNSPAEKLGHCYDYDKGKNLLIQADKMENYVCLSPLDKKSATEACKRSLPAPAVNACVFGAPNENYLFHCFDQVKAESNLIEYAFTENYLCVSPFDYKQLKEYCKRKQLDNKK
jgi:hypothetical protein